MAIAEQLDAVRGDLVAAQESLARLAGSVTDTRWTGRPKSGGWSAAECVAHLTMTTNAYMPMLESARASVPSGTPLPARYRRDFGAWLLEWILEPPSRARVKTLPAFIPQAAAPKAETVAAFDASQQRLLTWLDSSRKIALDHATITSPFNARMKYNAYAALRILAAHQRRHLWQAGRAAQGIP